METYPDCEQRIDRNLADRMDDMRDLEALMGCTDVDDMPRVGALGREILDSLDDEYTADDVRDAAWEWLTEYPLSIDVPNTDPDAEYPPYVRILLSVGGPSDEFRMYFNASGRCYSVEYRFTDWFDSASRVLLSSDKATVEACFGGYAETVWDGWRNDDNTDDGF